jgi:ABC-type oligopeptide transport system substrate-binding subunit
VRTPYAASSDGVQEIEGVLCPAGVEGDMSPILNALRRGDIDAYDGLAPTDAVNLPDFHWFCRPPDATAYLFFNVTAPGLWSRDLRAAIRDAIDVKAYARAVFDDEAAAATGLLAPVFRVPGRMRSTFRPQHAAAELKALKARLKWNTPMRMLVPAVPRPHTPNVEAAANALSTMLGACGLEVLPVVPSSLAEFARIAEGGQYDLALSGWKPDSRVPAETLESLLASTSIPGPARSVSAFGNLARFGNIELDRKLEAAAASGLIADLVEVQSLVEQHVPLVPLAWGSRAMVVRSDVVLRPGFSPEHPRF